MSPVYQSVLMIGLAALVAPLFGGEFAQTTIDFAPQVTLALEHQYGSAEGARLRTAILQAVSRETAHIAMPAGLTVTVLLEEVAPTRPTPGQLNTDPALDIMATKYIGGAALVGTVRDARQQVVATTKYRYFPLSLALGSASRDPWADARLAIDQFAVNLAAACPRTH